MSTELLDCPTLEVLLDSLRAFSDSRSLFTDDAQRCSKVALECGTLAARAFHRANTMELERKPMLAGIRDRLMANEGLKATPAEAKAREDVVYVAYTREAEAYQTVAQHFASYRDYYRQRADLLMREAA